MIYQRSTSTTQLTFLNNRLIEAMSKVCLNHSSGSSTIEASLRQGATIRITVFHRSARMEAFCHLLSAQQSLLEIEQVREKLAALDLGSVASDQLWTRQMAEGRGINWPKTQVTMVDIQITQRAMFTSTRMSLRSCSLSIEVKTEASSISSSHCFKTQSGSKHQMTSPYNTARTISKFSLSLQTGSRLCME